MMFVTGKVGDKQLNILSYSNNYRLHIIIIITLKNHIGIYTCFYPNIPLTIRF